MKTPDNSFKKMAKSLQTLQNLNSREYSPQTTRPVTLVNIYGNHMFTEERPQCFYKSLNCQYNTMPMHIDNFIPMRLYLTSSNSQRLIRLMLCISVTFSFTLIWDSYIKNAYSRGVPVSNMNITMWGFLNNQLQCIGSLPLCGFHSEYKQAAHVQYGRRGSAQLVS